MKSKTVQLPIFSGLDKVAGKWQVRFYKGRTFYVRTFQDIREAFQYAENTLKATHDEVILTVNI